ncbi:extracellular triacylglycerol lipase precursor [Mycena polygramma]|nr:extracellular triacylglycerol lipase precursor [Mycena polygramma]
MLFTVFVLASLSWPTPQVQLGNTTVSGKVIVGSSLACDFFGGIPFAEAPKESLRFLPPVLKTELPAGEFNASAFGYACLQLGMSTEDMSEDCLTVNVFRPSNLPADASLPVMFWAYGGGFVGGSAGQYDASEIVAQSVNRGTPIIYVSFNYRLGPLGFPQSSEAFQKGSLNLGIHDQMACLQWVQRFIAKFGGDPSKVRHLRSLFDTDTNSVQVTLAGQSSGATVMSAILFLRDISGLARAAIFESGSAATAGVFPADRGESDWQNFVGGVPSCNAVQNTSNTLACLQNANSTELLSGWSAATAKTRMLYPWAPALDGPDGLLSTLPSVTISQGNWSCRQFIAGTNLDEGTRFTPDVAFDGESIDELIIASFSPPFDSLSNLEAAAQKILQLYPNVTALGSPFNTGNETFGKSSQYKRASAIEGDIAFQAQRRFLTQTVAALGLKSFSYLFTQPQMQSSLGISHGSELPFVYGDVGPTGSSDRSLSSVMMDYWISFVTSLDPNDGLGNERPMWASYTSDNAVVMQLNGENMTMIPDDYRKDEIEYLVSIREILHS